MIHNSQFFRLKARDLWFIILSLKAQRLLVHGNAVAALACNAEFVLPTNFTNITNVYRCVIGFSPTDYTDFIDFLFSLYDSLFCFAKIALWIYTDFIAARWFFCPQISQISRIFIVM